MNASRILWLLTVGIAAVLGWFLGRSPRAVPDTKPHQEGPKILYYQSSMHPWIKSDRPGKCTICGMDLAPVFEGQAGFTGSEGLVTLSSNSITVSHVQTSPVIRQPVVRSVRLNGSVDDDDSRHRILSARVEGRIERLFVNYPGAEVRAGEPLALVYSPSLLTAVREYLALLKGPAGSGPIRDAAALRLVQLGLLPSQVDSLPGTFADTNLTLEILSPMTGTVVAKNVFEGQSLTVGQPLFELADFDTMWLKLQVYENDLGWLRPGQAVEITSPSLPGLVLTNAITFIDPNFNPQTRSTLIRVEIPNPLESTPTGPRRRIPHRVLAEARVRVASEPTLTIPRSAVLDSGQPLAYVELGTGAYEPRPLVIGLRGDREVEVRSGVSEGERVVTQGALLLDAQAQLHQLVQAPQEFPSADAETLPEPSGEQKTALKSFLKTADGVREALSSDSLDSFNANLAQLHQEAERLRDAFAAGSTGTSHPERDRAHPERDRSSIKSTTTAATGGQVIDPTPIKGQVIYPTDSRPSPEGQQRDKGTGHLSFQPGDRSSIGEQEGKPGGRLPGSPDKGTGHLTAGHPPSSASTWGQAIHPIVAASHLDPAPDLPSARREFHPLSERIVALASQLRALPEFGTLKVYQCPMTRRSFEGAPAKAAWLQLEGPIRNPYFGAEMLDCGTEVRP
jgi:membrane fusion protein, copper/silver efflux system